MKKAIIVASFGTTYIETRQKTIEAIVQDVTNAFPEVDIFQAYTSSIVRKRVKANEGIDFPSVEACLAQLIDQGYEKIYIQPTHIIPGKEFHKILKESRKYKDIVSVGSPLLTDLEDYRAVTDYFKQKFTDLTSDEAVLFMSHGTENFAFTSYATLDYMFAKTNIFSSCVEGYPGLDVNLNKLKSSGYQKLHLYPFMVVAGDHANNDMVGKEIDTWQGLLEAEGYEVIPHLEGLGELKFIRDKFINHLKTIM